MESVSPTALTAHIRQQAALSALSEFGVLLHDGHFDFGNGFHGTSYLNPHAIFHQPSVVLGLAQDLIEMLELKIRGIMARTQIVVGAVTGGAQLAFVMAALMGGAAGKRKTSALYAPIHRDPNNELVIREHYRKLIRGRKVLLVDDVRNTGNTFVRAYELIEECGGHVLATAELYDRLSVVQQLPMPNVPLAEYLLEQHLVPAGDCTLCKLRIPITKF